MDSLYQYRDHYFESHPLSDAAVKDERVQARMDECLQRLDQIDRESPTREM